MTEFGKYVLKYKAPKGSGESKVKMEISSEATLPEMLEFFADFLRASGYVFDGDIVIDNPREPLTCEKHWDNFWAEDGISMTGNPSPGSDTISFESRPAPSFYTSSYWMASGTDGITLG